MKKIIIGIAALLLLVSCGDKKPTLADIVVEEGEKIQILALGDSITAGYNLPIDDAYPSQLEGLLGDDKYEIINGGVSGDTSIQLLNRLDLYIEDDENLPALAIVTIGGNDGLRGQSLEDLENNIESIISKLKEKNIPIVISGMRIPINLGFQYSRDFKSLYKNIAKNSDVYFFEHFLEDVQGVASLNLNDRIHPNKQGYSIIAENMYEFLKDEKLVK
ncbi:arylesterase [Candidatus Gracilibacteria bacterium]|nr:arylesterase [Candidatus Gracilibacteria bacterium]